MDNFLKNYKKAPVTITLILICVIVYIFSVLLYGIEMSAQQAMNFGGYNPIYVAWLDEYYRIITANFIHFGLFHILVNCYSLYNLGILVESVLKTKRYLIVVIVSAIATNGLPYLLFLINGFGSQTVSGGISGVIFGIIGAFGALALKYRDIFLSIFRQLALNVGLMLFISLISPSISLSGHVSGLIGGFVSAYILLNVTVHKKNNHNDLLN